MKLLGQQQEQQLVFKLTFHMCGNSNRNQRPKTQIAGEFSGWPKYPSIFGGRMWCCGSRGILIDLKSTLWFKSTATYQIQFFFSFFFRTSHASSLHLEREQPQIQCDRRCPGDTNRNIQFPNHFISNILLNQKFVNKGVLYSTQPMPQPNKEDDGHRFRLSYLPCVESILYGLVEHIYK